MLLTNVAKGGASGQVIIPCTKDGVVDLNQAYSNTESLVYSLNIFSFCDMIYYCFLMMLSFA